MYMHILRCITSYFVTWKIFESHSAWWPLPAALMTVIIAIVIIVRVIIAIVIIVIVVIVIIVIVIIVIIAA